MGSFYRGRSKGFQWSILILDVFLHISVVYIGSFCFYSYSKIWGHVAQKAFYLLLYSIALRTFSLSLLELLLLPAMRTTDQCFKCIVYKHWPDTREFITQTVELWTRWIIQYMYIDTKVFVTHLVHYSI